MGNPPQHSHQAGRYAPDTKTSHTSLKVANGVCMMFHTETGQQIPEGSLQAWVGNVPSLLCHLTQAPRLNCSCQTSPFPFPQLNTPVINKNLPPSPCLLPPPFPTPSFQMPKGLAAPLAPAALLSQRALSVWNPAVTQQSLWQHKINE